MTNFERVQYEYDLILEDLIVLLDNLEQEYTDAQVNTWAWERLLKHHPELTPEEAWLG